MTRKVRMGGYLLLVLLGASPCLGTQSADKYPTVFYRNAGDHLDEIVWVEGSILRTEEASEGVYLLFSSNEKYVRIFIPAANVKNFDGSIQHRYVGKKLKAVGKVMKHGSLLIIGVNEPKRIEIVEKDTT